ncbi:hypothetical protein [Rothia amarae]|uniref:phage tail tube protein n=1 Tax=Rothia amarae TaxID=169480 RepID=UPI0031DF0C93
MATALAPKTLADGRIRLAFLPTLKDPSKPTVTELTAGIDLSCRVLKSDFRASPVGSETVDEMAALCETANASTPGQSNYEASMSVFRWFDATKPGQKDALGDVAYQAVKLKGTHGYLVKRETGKAYDAAWEAGDEIEVFEVVTDTPQSPSDAGGYIRRIIPMFVQDGWMDAVVATG